MHELNAVAEIGLTSLSLHFPTKSLICPIVHVTILFVCYTNTVTEFLFIKVSSFYRVTLCRARSCESKSSVCLLILWRWCRPMFFSHVLEFFENNFESVAIAVKTARCRCKLRYVPKFTAASRGALHAIARLLLLNHPLIIFMHIFYSIVHVLALWQVSLTRVMLSQGGPRDAVLEVFPLNEIANVGAPGSEDPRLISREIIFEVFQPMWWRYLNVTDGQTDDLAWHNRALA